MARSAPPRLRLRLFDRLQTLILVNLVPLLAGLTIAVLYWQGVIGIDMGRSELLVGVLALVAVGCMVFVGWCLLPVLVWMRDYCFWQYRNGSALAWALPSLAAALLWGIGLLLGLAICLVMLVALVTAAWRVLDPPPPNPPPSVTAWPMGLGGVSARASSS